MIAEEYQHLVVINLEPANIFKIDDRVDEIYSVKEWLEQLTHWQKDSYRWKIAHVFDQIHVWFKDQRHATMCRLRWK